MKNPVILAAHQHRLQDGSSPVVAQTVSAHIDKKGLHVVIEFAKTKLADEYWHLYSEKFQRAFSVGFIPGDSEYQMRGNSRVRVHTESELIEISCVAVGSNREALSKGRRGKRDFVFIKKIENMQQEDRDAAASDHWCDRLELWGETQASKRAEIFNAQEIKEFTKMDLDAVNFAQLLLNDDGYSSGDDRGISDEFAVMFLESEGYDIRAFCREHGYRIAGGHLVSDADGDDNDFVKIFNNEAECPADFAGLFS